MQAEVVARRARRARHDLVGHAVARPRRGSPRPARAGRRRRRRRVALHPRVARPATPTAATAVGGRIAGLVGRRSIRSRSVTEPPRRDRRQPGRQSGDASRRRAARPAATPDEVTLRRGHQVLPGLRHPAARRARRHRHRGEPAPGGRGEGGRVLRPRCPLALHRRAPEQQGRSRRPLRRRGGVGRPAQAGRPPRRRRARTVARGRRACSRSASTRPTQRAGPVPTPTTCRAGRGSPGGRHAAAAGPDGGRAARRGPGVGVRQAGRHPSRASSPNTPTPPGCRRG